MYFEKVIRILIDKRCILCGKNDLSIEIKMICQDCLKVFDIRNIRRCKICGHPLDDFNQCISCKKLGNIYFDSYYFIQYYTDFIKKIIYMLKKDENFAINILFYNLIIRKNLIKNDGIVTVIPDNFIKVFKKGRSGLYYLLKIFKKMDL